MQPIGSRPGWAGLLFTTAMVLALAAPYEAAAEALEVEDCEIPLPTGKCITPTAAPGSEFRALDPDLADFPDYRSGQAISTAVSPDRKTLLILVSGFNAVNGPDGNFVPEASTEYVLSTTSTGAMPAIR